MISEKLKTRKEKTLSKSKDRNYEKYIAKKDEVEVSIGSPPP